MNRAKRIVVAALVVAIAGMFALAIWRHTLDLRLGCILATGIVLGGVYAVSPHRYGAIRAAIERMKVRLGPVSLGVDVNVTDDDDPRNISPKVYLPILLGAIVLALVIAFLYLHK